MDSRPQGYPQQDHTQDAAIVVINPNNPTGAIYSDEILNEIIHIARQHNLIIFADEIYDKVLTMVPAHLDGRLGGRRVVRHLQWPVQKLPRLRLSFRLDGHVRQQEQRRADYLDGLNILASMRLCQRAGPIRHPDRARRLPEHQRPGRPRRTLVSPARTGLPTAYRHPGVTCVKPKAALYMFPRLDAEGLPIKSDRRFIRELLQAEKVLIVQGTDFNWTDPDHFRLVFLPN